MDQRYITLLREELIPALGCTEPIAIAYAAATAARTLGRAPQHILCQCSGNIIKNVQSVSVPNSGGLKGVAAAAALGALGGDPALELRDERNRQIDELSGLIDINVTYSEEEIAAGMKVEKLTISLDNANPDKSVKTDEALLIDGVFSAQLSFGTPMLNEEYDPEKVDALKQELDAGNITQDEYDALTDEEKRHGLFFIQNWGGESEETPEETPEPEEPAQNATGLNPAILLVVLALMGGGGAFAYFKLVKNKPKTKGNDNLDDYDYGEDDTDQEDEDSWETEDSDELDADGGGDEESEDKTV